MAVGDTNLFFNRDTKVYAVQYTGSTTANVWLLPVLNGYSFSQSTNSSQVTLNEMASATGNSRRGQASFNDSLAPAEWSFDLYARPTLSTVVRAPEEILWHSMLSETVLYPAAGLAAGYAITAGTTAATIAVTGGTADNIMTITLAAAPTGGTYFKVGDRITTSGLSAATGTVGATGTFTVTAVTNTTVSCAVPSTVSGTVTASAGAKVVSTTFATTATELDFLPTSSNKTKLGTFDLYFVLGASKAGGTADTYTASDATTIYRIRDCCVNEATVNFEIDGITTISFSGMGTKIAELASWTFTGTASNPGEPASTVYTLITTGAAGTTNMIRNRLTSLSLVSDTSNTGIGAKTYGITLTGGSITISNNMTFLTPESIGVVNTPLGHVTGTRSISGSFTCYADEITNGSIQLYEDLLGATGLITNKFALQFFVGGRGGTAGYPASPGIMFDLGQCHLEIPTINIDDVIGYEVNFTALPSTISGTDELTKIRYVS
jgi:hypothetical protein